MSIINKKGAMLIELILYTGIVLVSIVLVFSMLISFKKLNSNLNLDVSLMSNITNSEIYLNKALNSVNNILILYHKNTNINMETPILNNDLEINNKYFNQYEFSLTNFKNKCWFIINDKYDLVAFTSKKTIDPIIVGVIERTTDSGRKYEQLAIYSYRNINDMNLIKEDFSTGLNNYIDKNWRYKTWWLTDWKCDINNWFLIPISSKNFLDLDKEAGPYFKLESLKIFTDSTPEEIKRYWNWLVEFHLTWEKRKDLSSKYFYQTLTKIIN